MNYRWFKEQWDRALALLAAIVGVVALVLGWFGASDATLTVEQVPYVISGAVAGLFALGIAATLWLSADLRDEWAKLDEINEALNRGATADLEATSEDTAAASARPRRQLSARAQSSAGAR